MSDKATTNDKTEQLRSSLIHSLLQNNPLPKISKPEPVMQDEACNSDDDLPPPVPIDPNWKPILAWELVTANNVQPKPASAMSAADLDFTFDERKGRYSPLGISFSPFLAVTKYCYKFVNKSLMQPLASAFFDADKIWSRDWDL